jgi:hyperosmotically inducible periplasmic protein
MNTKLASICFLAGALTLPIAGFAAESDRSSPKAFAEDTVITTKIKSELAEEKLSSLVKIEVDTDHKGMVTLAGTAPNQKAVDKAVSIARSVEGVKSVENHIRIAADK